jgi:lipoprotein-releasing system ATP-binding protein
MSDRMGTGSHPVLQLVRGRAPLLQGENQISILDGADFTLNAGETVALVAPSGTGKSTLLHLAGLLEHPDEGDVLVNGESCGRAFGRPPHRDPALGDRLRLPVPSSAAGIHGA